MRSRHFQKATVKDDEISSDEIDEVFDVDGADGGYDTDITEPDPAETEDPAELDVEDQLRLFDGNAYPPEYYRQAVLSFNAAEYEHQDYAPSTATYLDGIEEQWTWYDIFHDSFSYTNS
jgi:hypothetical protein